MKIAAPPCSFKLYNKENPTGSDAGKHYVSSFSFSGQAGAVSDVVSGGVYIDEISVKASITVVNPVASWTGTASFVFPARHWAFVLDGHATLAVGDTVDKTVTLETVIAEIPVKADFAVTAEIEASSQDVWDDWSQT